jgi:molecular chaperone GrpE
VVFVSETGNTTLGGAQAEVKGEENGGTALLRQELTKLKENYDQLNQRYLYLRAEYENLIKRTQREIDEIKSVANERTIKRIIDLRESVNVALGMIKGRADQPVVDGFELIKAKIEELLTSEGVSEVKSIGQKFDPYYHEVAGVVESDLPDGTIIEEIRTGYLINGKVLRPSIVKVSKRRVG